MSEHYIITLIIGIVVVFSSFTGIVGAANLSTVSTSCVYQSGGNCYVWQSDSYTVTVEFTADEGSGYNIVVQRASDGEDLERKYVEVSRGETRSVPVEIPRNMHTQTGEVNLEVELWERNIDFDDHEDTIGGPTVYVVEKSEDRDNDGLSNQEEVQQRTKLMIEDTDGDGLDDGPEVNRHDTDPTQVDTDNDGLSDGDEVNRYRTDPTVADTDNDGLDDGTEINQYNTDPNNAHTDGDGLNDGREVNELGTDPTSTDTDGDGLDDGAEVDRGTDPTEADTDGDGLNDGREINQFGTNPTNTDTDGDGLDDGEEIQRGTDPTIETDSDHQETSTGSDSQEINQNPNNQDTSATPDSQQTTVNSDQQDASADSSASEEVQRGFFTNNSDSDLAFLNNPFTITWIGFLLSIVGILFELRRGG